jgi:hypothetical protein
VSHRPLRPLVVVVVLAGGDYLLWNWSLSHNHDILALVAGMTLPPLLIALVWLVVVGSGRLIASTARRWRAGSPRRVAARPGHPVAETTSAGGPRTAPGGAKETSSTSSKLAA